MDVTELFSGAQRLQARKEDRIRFHLFPGEGGIVRDSRTTVQLKIRNIKDFPFFGMVLEGFETNKVGE